MLRLIQWTREETAGSEVALNLMLSTGQETVGLRFGRTACAFVSDKLCTVFAPTYIEAAAKRFSGGSEVRSVS